MRDESEVFWIVVITVFVAVAIGLWIGYSAGLFRACDSVKMEWVKDKCMKVTREEVK